MTAKQNLSRSGSTFDGVLRKTLEAHCRICGQANLGLSGDHNEAKRELRLEGWETREGLWICPCCANVHPPGTVTFAAQGMPSEGPRRECGSGALAPASPVPKECAPTVSAKGVRP